MFVTGLLYNNLLPTVNNTGDEQYNGNIAAVKWNTPEFGMKAYGYGYDEINRLERAKFAAGTALDTDVDKYSVENITYDANGNILTLGRHNTAAGYIDNLTMTYDGNQLKKKDDSGDLVLGFVDIVDEETEYHYDLNGNMDIDENKGIMLTYNYMNLLEEVVGGNDTVRYIYDANGRKLSKELVQGGSVSYTDYVGNFVNKDGDLDYITTSEGRITQPTAGTFQYEYFLKDHLGNTRAVFADGNGDGVLADNEVLQETHYYPFGMSIGDLAVDRGADNKLKYNGKELQDDQLDGIKLNYYDYGARFLDDFRWNVIDNKAEKYYSVSPYVYALNNPIKFIDPDGNEVGIAYLSDKHQVSLNNMLSTEAGRAFVGRYMKAGDKLVVGNKTYTWDKTGDRSKDFLQISSTSNLGRKGLNSTMKKGTYRTTNALTPSEMAKTAVEGVYQAIQLDSDLSSESATVVLGHEAFVHADKDADRLTNLDKKMESGNATEEDVIDTMYEISTSGDEDHKALGEGKVEKFESMTNELSNKSGNEYYKKEYEKQVERYKEE